jgi:hypothetical protein
MKCKYFLLFLSLIFLFFISFQNIPTGLSVFFFCNSWLQGPALGSPLRYDLAGMGTKHDPGICWYFKHLNKNNQK